METACNLELVVFRKEPGGNLVLVSGDPVTDRNVAVVVLAPAAPTFHVEPSRAPAKTSRIEF